MKARLATEIGTRVYLRRYWGEGCPGKYGYHNAKVFVKDILHGEPEPSLDIRNYPDEMWPKKCDHCDCEIPEHATKQVFTKRLYDTPSGDLEPGCIFWADWYPENFYWDNHKGPCLIAVLPNGDHWNIDSRASNCDMPNDRLHRCWCRHGEVPNIHVDKNGHTCNAGAGSIMSGNYHGFLHNGEFTDC